jgi:thiosulfate dehydrogenase
VAGVAVLAGAVLPAGRGLAQAPAPFVWERPALADIPAGPAGDVTRIGAEVFARTFAFLGPDAERAENRYAGNNLACGNCHLDLGRKKFGFLLVGAARDYPRPLRPGGPEQTLAQRINQCMERSLAGRALPGDHPLLAALTAYITFLSAGIPPGVTPDGAGRVAVAAPPLPPDAARGAALYRRICAECHRPNGLGAPHGPAGTPWGYAYPPLWGPDSFAASAGLAEPKTFAGFIHANMPQGVDWAHPRLSVQQAHDIAAFVLSHPRPDRPGAPEDHLRR